jgi:hypothetical protein
MIISGWIGLEMARSLHSGRRARQCSKGSGRNIMRPGLSLALLPMSGQMRSGALFSDPEVTVELEREDPALTIEEGGVRFELEFSSRDRLAAFVERVSRIEVPELEDAAAP